MVRKYTLISMLLTGVVVLLAAGDAFAAPAPANADYTAIPPFLSGSGGAANVLLIMDNSLSMNEFAYKTPGTGNNTNKPDTSFDPTKTYYGYFNPSDRYNHSGNNGYFYVDNASAVTATWSGNFLNWLTMRRIDVIKKVLVGGKATPRSGGTPNYLLVQTTNWDFYKRYNVGSGNYVPSTFTGTRCFEISGGNGTAIKVSTSNTGTCGTFTAGTYNIKVKYSDTDEPLGLLQRTWANLRFGLMKFNEDGSKFENGGGSNKDGGTLVDRISTLDKKLQTGVNIIPAIENMTASTYTPLAETLYEATRYFSNQSGAYDNTNYNTGAMTDDAIQSACAKNYVLILTDGESTQDRNIPGGAWGTPTFTNPDALVGASALNIKTEMDSIATQEGTPSQWNVAANSLGGTYYLEGVSYWAHKVDLKPTLAERQNLTIYAVYAFDDSAVGRDLLQKSAKYGGFDDMNGNDRPDLQNEWDSDHDGIPDTYYEAQEGDSIETALLEAFTAMMKNTASGSAVSVLATTGEGEGAITQAYFYPTKVQGDNIRQWMGNINSFFVDKWGNIREDTDEDAVLDTRPANCDDQDRIINVFYDESQQPPQTRVRYLKDVNCDGLYDVSSNNNGINDAYTLISEDSLDTVHPLWSGGKRLWERAATDRKILTTLNGYDYTGLAMDATMGNFQTGNAAALQNILRATTVAQSTDIIKWVRGQDIVVATSPDAVAGATTPPTTSPPVNMRLRTYGIGGQTKVWKLGDIIYSTPMVVSKPAENMDLLYGSASYARFRTKYLNRRNTVYVGANDGMLHAFNGGFYDKTNHAFCLALTSGGVCDTSVTTPPLGHELWAFIPRGLLPHLQWLTKTNYAHVYYVDLKPKVADVQIFAEEAACATSLTSSSCVHPGGWGTILIGGMRLGGKSIAYTGGTAYPEYFALDITDPLSPRLLWTFTDADLGLTMSEPAIARTCDANKQNCRWFAIFGSGPTNFDMNSNLTAFQTGRVYVLNMSSGIATPGDANAKITSWSSSGSNQNWWTFVSSNTKAFMSNPIAVDVDLDFDVDTIYIGENCTDTGSDACCAANSPTCKNAYLKRITTDLGRSNSPASNWVMSTLANVEGIDLANVPGTSQETARRITAAPSAATDDKSNLWVYFGTGQFIGADDKTNGGNGAFFGIRDGCWKATATSPCTTSYTALNDVSNTVVCYGGGDSCPGGTSLNDLLNPNCDTTAGYCYANSSVACTTHADCATDGWAVFFNSMTTETTDFAGDVLPHSREISISKPLVLGGLVVWPTYIPPADECAGEGDSNVYAVYYKTGTAYKRFVYQAQKNMTPDADESTVVARAKFLGKGVPSSISAQVTASGRAKGYAQSSTGAIIEIENNTPFSLKSNVIGWRSEEIP